MIVGYQAAVAQVRARVLAYVERAWRGLGRYDRGDIERFVELILPQIAGGQVTTASLTDAYLAQLERTVLGSAARTVGVDAASVLTEALRGVPAAEVYQRAGVTVWRSLADGVPYERAVERGLERALSMASTDLQLAKTHTARAVMAPNEKIARYRRSLTGGRSCGLCVVSATKVYRKQDLQPIHPGCDCGVLPIFFDRDPGLVVDPDLLDGVQARIEERFGAFNSGAREIPGVSKPNGKPLQYRDVLITHEHGELGPILGVRGQQFTGPNDI